MSKDVAGRDYSLRNSGRSIKYTADGKCLGKVCNNCTLLSLEIDKLRRQIALLTKHVQDTPSNDNVIDNSADISLKHENRGTQTIRSGNGNYCFTSNQEPNAAYLTTPFDRLYPGVTSYIDTIKLDSNTKYSHNFSSRNVAYYGVYPYVYSGGCHEPIPFSENPYLEEVLENMRIHFPNLQFNSAMVTKYLNGQQGIPSHSDDEDCISAGSMICTISLGETRTLEFRSKCKTSLVNSKIRLAHGDVLFMTRGSQNQFQHSVPKDYTKNMRVSITLRHITCNINPVVSLTNVRFHECEIQASSVLSVGSTSKSNNTIINPSKDDQFPELGVKRTSIGVQTAPSDTSSASIPTDISSNTVYPVEKPTNNDCHAPNSEESRSTSIYISSSMFRQLDCCKLSSKSQEAHVFSYPGATAEMIKQRFQGDENKKALDPNKIKNIMLMCGSNDIDSILRSPKEMRNKILQLGKPKSYAPLLDKTNRAIEDLVLFLHQWAPLATVKIINILPRESRCRNELISNINQFIINLKNKHDFVNFITTERERFLFTDRLGYRRSCFFSSHGEDNIHLNSRGMIKLAKHLKHHAHH